MEVENKEKASLYFKNLDSLRFIAAFLVFYSHGFAPAMKLINVDNKILQKTFHLNGGGTGVSIFFVLSGFLITYKFLKEYENESKISIINFYIKRTLRIWPLYFLVIFISFFILPQLELLVKIENQTNCNILYHLLFVSNFDALNILKTGINQGNMAQGINWSVSIEEQFYIFWPLVFIFLNKKHWIFTFIGLLCFSLYFRISNSNNTNILYFHTFAVMMDFCIGAIFSYIIVNFKRIRVFFENGSIHKHLLFICISLILITFKTNIFDFENGQSFERLFISFSFGMIITAQAINKKNNMLDFQKLTFANQWGKYTYGIYLIHPISFAIIEILYKLIDIKKELFFNSFIFALISFSLTLLLSKISYHYFEIYFINLKSSINYSHNK